ncbi:Nif3-like dinuclear metal center hexameric protein [Buchnera aphidicola]|uniref:Nif3-like dinuclear metal center hexameric protein n=1 Tax=Buchnera aphidicola TaxID=9 RepID=UPI0034647228
MNNFELEKVINKKLFHHNLVDIIPNGLQIEGSSSIYKIITGVSICQELIDFAVYKKAQAIIVHHGFFWKNESQRIIYNKRKRLHKILLNNINVYNWHFPLDVHPELGNNVQIAKKLNINILGKINDFVLWGKFFSSITVQDLYKKLELLFFNKPIYFSTNIKNVIHNIAWCSGKGQNFLKNVLNFNLDSFLTGEASEDTIYFAKENNINFFSVGHYSTERYGIQALGDWLIKKHNLHVEFFDVYNPI